MENKIKEYRKALGLSQDDLAKACGVSRQTINAIENNKYDPSLVLAFQLSYVLGGTVDTIFMFRKNEKP
ncbi:helix-turn-helix transcriptional regulator [Brevibacillus laterosporus]|uniref:DNA-binding protein n=2 Tax=Brevibacillus TaxID=55080 RepID=A0A0F6XYR7_BRELA|nr:MULTISPECIES: helix-turn-helix transcriptional regulator [Brevibacillus]AKF92496.1 DNA-binding protein [Brevibacillus laterosporus]MCR8984593.1 helix-turn-helix transcriptional regulator [Brevibacillus laterosporus]MCZ0830319.1 helix-turn-helix transcriptional regulator [Brevibacillus halotolerans]GIO01161.1 transcriptional regulator [Brevibacillus halotolerans]